LQLVAINVAELVKVPKPTKRQIQPLTVEQSRAFLAVTNRHRLGAACAAAAEDREEPADPNVAGGVPGSTQETPPEAINGAPEGWRRLV
jgi:hypothetical protein